MSRSASGSVAAVVLAVISLAGCGRSGVVGSLQVESASDDPVMLRGTFHTAVYANDPYAETSFILLDVPVDEFFDGAARRASIVHLTLLWRPKPGATPMDASATNVSIRYVVLADGEVGVYGGGGFAVPRGSLKGDRVTVELEDGSLGLLESTDGFVDLLTRARIHGRFTATLDPERTWKLRYAVSQLVTNALGRTRHVQVPPDWPADAPPDQHRAPRAAAATPLGEPDSTLGRPVRP